MVVSAVHTKNPSATSMLVLSIGYDFYGDPSIIQCMGIYEKCKGAYAMGLLSLSDASLHYQHTFHTMRQFKYHI